jgi:hypothetical protein
MRNLHQYYSSRTNEEYKDNIRNLGYRGQLQNVHMQFIIQNRHLYYAARYCEGYFNEPIITQGYDTWNYFSDFIGIIGGHVYDGLVRCYGTTSELTAYYAGIFNGIFSYDHLGDYYDSLLCFCIRNRISLLKYRIGQDKKTIKKHNIYFAYTIPRKFLKRGVLMFVNNIGKPKIYNIKGVK